MFLTPKRILLFCGCLILVGGTAFHVYQQNKPAPEPVNIYKAPELVPKQDTSVKKASPVEAAPSEVTSIEDAHAGHDHLPHEHSHDTPEISAPAVTDLASPNKKDDVLSEEAIQKWMTEVMEELKQLDKHFMEKYPELFEIGMMTKEEFLETYSTPEAQQALLKYAQRVRPEMFAELYAVFSNLPIEIVDDILLTAKDHFVELWGQETADQVMRQLRKELGL